MQNLIKTCGPEIIAIVEAIESLAAKIKSSIEIVEHNEPDDKHLLRALLIAIKKAAEENRPYTMTGPITGLYGRRGELQAAFHQLSKRQFDAMARELLDHGEIIKCSARGSMSNKWLDVPNGKYACGFGKNVTIAELIKKNGAN